MEYFQKSTEIKTTTLFLNWFIYNVPIRFHIFCVFFILFFPFFSPSCIICTYFSSVITFEVASIFLCFTCFVSLAFFLVDLWSYLVPALQSFCYQYPFEVSMQVPNSNMILVLSEHSCCSKFFYWPYFCLIDLVALSCPWL